MSAPTSFADTRLGSDANVIHASRTPELVRRLNRNEATLDECLAQACAHQDAGEHGQAGVRWRLAESIAARVDLIRAELTQRGVLT